MFDIKNKIKHWLLKDEITEIESLKKQLNDLKVPVDMALENYNLSFNQLKKAMGKYEAAYKLSDDALRLVNKVTDVSVDVGFHNKEHSWAVVCIGGKKEYVKFAPLTNKDAMSVIEFLRMFKYSDSLIIDSPFAFKEMVKHEILKD